MRTTKLTPSVRRLDTGTGLPSSRYTVDLDRASLGLMSRACSDGEPDIVVALPHPQSAPLATDEKHTVLCEFRSDKDAGWDDVITAAGEKAVAAAAMRAPPTMRFLIV